MHPTLLQLKQTAAYPECIELVDTTAKDPLLLVHLKCYKNTVEVPKS